MGKSPQRGQLALDWPYIEVIDLLGGLTIEEAHAEVELP
jgi:hypothetical protein